MANASVIRTGHVDDDGGFGGNAEKRENMRLGRPGVGAEKNMRGEAAVGKGDLRCGSGTEGGRDAGNDFEIDMRGAESSDFFGGAAEQERVAALEANNGGVFLRRGDEQGVDFVLREKTEAAAFADIDALRGSGDELEDCGADEGVVEDDVCAFQDARSLAGEKFGITRARADEEDLARHQRSSTE